MTTKYNIYEIYIEKIIAGQVVDDILSIVALNRKDAESFPFFHSIIMIEGTMGDDRFAVLNSGLPTTSAVRASIIGMAA
jgi:hypothetical protein